MLYLGLVCLRALLAHHCEELLEVDGAVAVEVGLHDQVLDLVLGGVLADGSHNEQQLLCRDSSAAVLEKNVRLLLFILFDFATAL